MMGNRSYEYFLKEKEFGSSAQYRVGLQKTIDDE